MKAQLTFCQRSSKSESQWRFFRWMDSKAGQKISNNMV